MYADHSGLTFIVVQGRKQLHEQIGTATRNMNQRAFFP